MVGVPKWLDQLINAKFIDETWEVGVEAKEDEKRVVRREYLMSCLKQVIDEFVEQLKYSSNKKGLVKDVTNGHCCLGTLAVLFIVEFAYAVYFCHHSSRNVHNPVSIQQIDLLISL
ncbi:Crocetin glucosyltransferase 2 [Camellia lanceoleosa]|uniref:Crocetin glucosyltransferase 2 n=1 Tax=Camellia lanceoleosa TaxID=1840588 RepID=A0ACC0GYM4_9ERIC|nr:Crocetin glucosyltransferase 2 [Camellia lanceoleosa]